MSERNAETTAVVCACFYSGEDTPSYGCYAPKDAHPMAVIASLVWHIEPIKVTLLLPSEVESLLADLWFMPMRSVVKADWDDLGTDFDWHTDGSGKRSKDCWWVSSNTLNEIIDRALARIQATADHAGRALQYDGNA